ncbi:hypothetical protein AB1K54_09455 [Microbacterium sp. BWT-B31]|uniref:SCO7613 C-terminal domain-containing membrane protein n=1 Tax=Microbacterium sp. BWT-B31 TaxID=3232072 RepID=UPI00352898A5
MTSSPVDTADPAYPGVLADVGRCPSCFAAAPGALCAGCGLDLDDARMPRVRSLGRQILGLERERCATIQAIRATQADAAARAREADAARAAEAAREREVAREREAERVRAAEAARAAEQSLEAQWAFEAEPAHADAAVALTSMPPAPGGEPWPSPRPPVEASARRRRLTVPALLLTVGVSLVGIAAVFFLLLAWFVWGLAVRAMIIGAVTLAVIGVATWLRRRSLTATAEGLAVLGMVLLGLDGWAIRANDLFGTGATDAAIYTGVTALVVGVGARAWASLSGLRAPDLAAAVSVPVGVGLLVGGMLPLAPAPAAAAGLLAASAATLGHALPVPWSTAARERAGAATRVVLAGLGVAALAAAAAVSFAAISGVAGIVVVNLAVCALGLAHARLLPRTAERRVPAGDVLAGVASGLAAAVAALTGWQLAMRVGPTPDPLLYAPVIAVAVAVACDLGRVRMPRLRAAAVSAGVVGALSILTTVTVWWASAGAGIAASWIPWRTAALAWPATADWPSIAAISVAVVLGGLLFVSPTLARPVLRDVRVVVAAALLLCAAAAPALALPAVAVTLAVAAVAVAALARGRARTRSGADPRSRTGWIVAGVGATTAAYLESTAAPWLWGIAVAAAIALPIALRLALRPSKAASVALAVAPVAVAAVSAVVAPAALGAVLEVTGPGVRAATLLVQAIAFVALAVALLVPIDRASRAALALAAEVILVITILSGAGLAAAGSHDELAARLGGPVTGFAIGCLVLAALVAAARRGSLLSASAAIGAAALTAPVLALTLRAGLAALALDTRAWTAVALLASAVAVVGLAAWTALRTPVREGMPTLRVPAEIGAAAAALLAVWQVGATWAWAALGLTALGFAAMSVTRGWTGATTSPEDDVFATNADGAPLAAAPRRLFVWPAATAAVGAWWLWLAFAGPSGAPVEAYAIPAGVALVGLAGALVRLRRRGEASVCLALGLAIGLGMPALASAGADARAIAVAVVAAGACLALALTPVRRVRPTAPVGAVVALAALGTVAIGRAVTGGAGDAAWLVLLVGTAIASGRGFALAEPARASSRAFAAAVVPLTVAAATLAVLPSGRSAAVVSAALALLTLLHVGCAALGREPLTAATRWTAFAGAAAVGIAGLALGGLAQVEAATLPLAGALLAAAALSTARRRRDGQPWPAGETSVWLAGLALATAPSLFAPIDAVRATTVIGAALAGAVGVALAPIPAAWRVRVPSAVLLAASALAMGARVLAAPSLAGSEVLALGAALGAIAVAAALIATSAPAGTTPVTTPLTAAGVVLAVAVVVVHADGDLVRTTVTVLAAGLAGVAVATVLRSRTWRGFAGVAAIGAAVVATAASGIRFLAVGGRPGLEADFWVLIAALVATSIAVAALGSTRSRTVWTATGRLLAALVAALSAGELLLVAQADTADVPRTAITMTALVAATVAGLAWRRRWGFALALTTGVTGAVFALATTLAFGVRPFEIVALPAALGGLAVGAHVLMRHPSARSWPVLGPWITLLTLPSLCYDAAVAPGLVRVVTLGVAALALVVIGALLRLQAPLVLGSTVLLAHGAAQLWPWIAAAYATVPWWLWLGIGGAVLIFLAATYERRVRQLRTAVTAVASLR